MQVLGVVGAADTGTTATAVNLAAALRREGHFAAVLDLSGDVADRFDVQTDGTLADALRGDATTGSATATVTLPHGDVEDALADYAAALGRDQTAFRAGDVEVDTGEAEPGELPVVVGGDRSALAEVDDEALSNVRGDLEFAFDYLVADAGTLGPAVARFPDEILVVTDTREDSLSTAAEGIEACQDGGLAVVGSVVNRATDRTDVSTIGDRLGAEILAVIPEDARTPEIEPVAFTAPESPAALAYGRLAGTFTDDDDGDDNPLGREPDQPVVTDGHGDSDQDTVDGDHGADDDGDAAEDDDHGADDEDGDGGFLGRLSDRFR